MCHECIHVAMAILKFLGVLHAPVAEHPLSKFLDPPLVYELQLTLKGVVRISTRETVYSVRVL